MTRIMFDAVTPGNIPVDAQLAALYCDGKFAVPASAFDRFSPQTRRVWIAVFASTNRGSMLDVEQGNATPEQAPGWVAMRRAAGEAAPMVYMNAATWPAVRAAFAAQGVPEPLYNVALWDGVQVIPPLAFAKQFANDTTHGYDVSIIGDYWPGVDPPPLFRRNDVHADLTLGNKVIMTNPASILGGTSHLCLSTDFGDSTVRVATWDDGSQTWSSVHLYPVGRAASPTVIPLPSNVGKVSLVLEENDLEDQWTVGVDILA